ncbi:MAG: helix-turn-helix domain-containing protein [Clostridia bacterium]|nr:helix-turn-helix domain-containing protein [Clostridia bacterium]
MKHKLSSVKRRSFYSFYMAIIIFLILPISVMLIAFSAIVNSLVTKDYMSLNKNAIDNITHTIDTYITSRINLADMLSLNKSLKTLVANVDESLYETDEACRELRYICASVQGSDRIFANTFICIPDRDMVISNQVQKISMEDFYHRYLSFSDISSMQFYDSIQSLNASQYTKAMVSSSITEGQNMLMLYAQPIDLNYLSHKAYFISFVNIDELSKLIRNYFKGTVYYQIFDTNGNELAASDSLPWEKVNIVEEHWTQEYEGIQYHAFNTISRKAKLNYIFYVPETSVLRQMKSFKSIWVIVLISCFIVCAFIAFLLANHLYNPLQRLLSQAFPEGVLSNTFKISDEYSLISEELNKRKLLNQKFRKEIHKYYESTKSYVLLRMLSQSATLSQEQLYEYSEICELPPGNRLYQVVVIDHIDALSMMQDIYNCFADSKTKHVLLSAQLSTNRMVILISIPHDVLDFIPLLPEAIMSRLRNNNVNIGISRLHKGIENLQYGLREALTACKSIENTPDSNLVHYGDLLANAKIVHYPMEKEIQIITAVKSGSYADVQRHIQDIRDYNLSIRPILPEMAACLLNDLIATAFKAYNSIKTEHHELISQSLDMINKLNMEHEVNDQFFDTLLVLYRQLCQIASESLDNKNHDMIENVIQFLEANYSDSNLSLSVLADHLNVSYYFLSHIFKNETNKNFSQIINEIRIKKSMEMLKNTNDTVKDISLKCGYTNWSTFINAFKKTAGCTPIQYRKDSLRKKI